MNANAEPGEGDDRQFFILEGECWTIRFEGTLFRLRDGVGLRHIAHLLARPGERIAATDLSATAGNPDGAIDRARARVSVTRTVRSALLRIYGHHPALFAHLQTTLKTGNYCGYVPDERVPIQWDVSLPPSTPTRTASEARP